MNLLVVTTTKNFRAYTKGGPHCGHADVVGVDTCDNCAAGSHVVFPVFESDAGCWVLVGSGKARYWCPTTERPQASMSCAWGKANPFRCHAFVFNMRKPIKEYQIMTFMGYSLNSLKRAI